MKRTSTRKFIAGLEHDSISCVVNAYRDAIEFAYETGQPRKAHAIADQAFRDALASLAPAEKFQVRNARTGAVESVHESFDEALAWAERYGKQTGADYLVQEAE